MNAEPPLTSEQALYQTFHITAVSPPRHLFQQEFNQKRLFEHALSSCPSVPVWVKRAWGGGYSRGEPERCDILQSAHIPH